MKSIMHKIYIIKFLIIASFTFSLIPLKNIEAKTNNPKAQNPTKAEKKKSKSSNVVKNPETIANSNQVINPEPQNDLVRKFHDSFEIGIGKLNGKAQEIVYSGNKKISHLDWSLRDVKMLSFKFDSRFSEIFNIGFKYSNNIDHGSERGLMYDYDWLGKGYDGNINENNWTHRSISKLKVQKIQQFKLTSSFNIYKEIFFANLGYNYDSFKWRDYAQNYIYSSYNQNTDTAYNFRQDIGSFGGVRAVSYEQNFFVPFIGFAFKNNFFDKKLAIDFYANYSPIARAIDYDKHHLTGVEYKQKFREMKYYNYGFNLGGKIYENFYAGLGYDFTYYPLKRGDIFMYSNNKIYLARDSAGIRNKSQTVSFNLKYNFTSNY